MKIYSVGRKAAEAGVWKARTTRAESGHLIGPKPAACP